MADAAAIRAELGRLHEMDQEREREYSKKFKGATFAKRSKISDTKRCLADHLAVAGFLNSSRAKPGFGDMGPLSSGKLPESGIQEVSMDEPGEGQNDDGDD